MKNLKSDEPDSSKPRKKLHFVTVLHGALRRRTSASEVRVELTVLFESVLLFCTTRTIKYSCAATHFSAQIFENRSNLASNCRASNRKFLATFEPPIRNS